MTTIEATKMNAKVLKTLQRYPDGLSLATVVAKARLTPADKSLVALALRRLHAAGEVEQYGVTKNTVWVAN